MKRALFMCVLAALIILAAVPALAGSAKASIPFAFTAGKTALEPGIYEIAPQGYAGVFSLTSPEGKRVMLMTSANGAPTVDASRLVFVRSGSGYALAEIRMAGTGSANVLPVKRQSPFQVAVVLH